MGEEDRVPVGRGRVRRGPRQCMEVKHLDLRFFCLNYAFNFISLIWCITVWISAVSKACMGWAENLASTIHIRHLIKFINSAISRIGFPSHFQGNSIWFTLNLDTYQLVENLIYFGTCLFYPGFLMFATPTEAGPS